MGKRKTNRHRRGGASQPQRSINIVETNLTPTEFFHNPIPLTTEIHRFDENDTVRVISGPYTGNSGTIFEVLNDGTYEVYLEPHGGEETLDGTQLVLEGGRRKIRKRRTRRSTKKTRKRRRKRKKTRKRRRKKR